MARFTARPEERVSIFQEISLLPKKQTFRSQLKERFFYGTSHYALLAGDAGKELARKVGDILGKEVPPNPPAFANGESKVVVPGTVETRDVYVIQSMIHDPDTSLRQLKLLDAGAKMRDANRIFNIFTHLPYARQDRVDQPGAPNAAQQVVNEIFIASSHNPLKRRWQHQSKLRAEGSLMVVDVHSEKPLEIVSRDSRGRYQWANLDSAYVLAPQVQKIISQGHLDTVVAFPDKGAEKRYTNYAHIFGDGQVPVVIKKERPVNQNNIVTIASSQEDVSERVKEKDIFLFDDMIDTGGSILQAAKLLKKQGARSVRVVATHGVFSNDALTKMADPAIDQVIITDSIQPSPEIVAHPKIEVVSIAPLLAEVIKRIEAREPINDLVKSLSPQFEKSYRALKRRANYFRRKQAKNE